MRSASEAAADAGTGQARRVSLRLDHNLNFPIDKTGLSGQFKRNMDIELSQGGEIKPVSFPIEARVVSSHISSPIRPVSSMKVARTRSVVSIRVRIRHFQED